MGKKIIVPCADGTTLCAEDGNLLVRGQKAEDIIPINNIQSFTLKMPTKFSYAKITIKTAQPNEVGINIGFGFSFGFGSGRTFAIWNDDLDSAIELRNYISQYNNAPVAEQPETESLPSEGSVVAAADELRALKRLLDDGLITQDDYDAKKKQLLGI